MRLCSVQTSQMRMVTVHMSNIRQPEILTRTAGGEQTTEPNTTKESKTPRGVALAGGNHEQEKKQSRVPQEKSRTTTRQSAVPLVQQSTCHRSGSSHPLRPRRRRHRVSPRMQTMQLQTRSAIHQRQPNSSCTFKSRTPRTRPNAKTKTKTK